MDKIGVVGVSILHSPPGTLSRFTIPKEEQLDRLPTLRNALRVDELVYVATCNRVELFFRGGTGSSIAELRRRVFAELAGAEPAPGEAERTLRAWAGEGAVEHLFVVTCGLDSARPGEHEVRGQVRDALKMARAAGVAGQLLDHVVSEALRAASRIQQAVIAPEQSASMADLAVDHLRRRLLRTPGPVALVGVSPMTRRVAHALAHDGVPLFLANRTVERAEELAREIGGATTLSLDELRSRPPAVEAMLLATGCPIAILGRTELERLAARSPSGEPPLLLDMAVPPDVDPAAARAADVRRLGMEEIAAEAEASRRECLLELAPARELIDEGLRELRCELAERRLSPVIARLNQRYRQTAAEGVERLFRKELPGLDEEQREVVRRWAEVLARRFAHIPTKGLRGLAADLGMPAARAFLESAGEELDDEAAAFSGALPELESFDDMETAR